MDLTYFQYNFNLFTTVRLVFEYPTFGGTYPRAVPRTIRIYRYESAFDKIVLGLELLFVAMVVYYTFEELVEIYRERCSYFADAWNLLDWINLLIFYIVIFLRLLSWLKLRDFDFDAVSIEYIDFLPLTYVATQVRHLPS